MNDKCKLLSATLRFISTFLNTGVFTTPPFNKIWRKKYMNERRKLMLCIKEQNIIEFLEKNPLRTSSVTTNQALTSPPLNHAPKCIHTSFRCLQGGDSSTSLQ